MKRRYAIKQNTTPTVLPVSLEEIRDHLRITTNDRDAELSRALTRAIAKVQADARTALINTTFIEYYDGWPLTESQPMDLNRAPVQSITSIQYVDTAEATQTWTSADYVLDNYTSPARIRVDYGKTIPATLQIENSVIITYVVGYGATAASVPENAKHAIKLWVEWEFDGTDRAMTAYQHVIGDLMWGGVYA